MIWRVVQPIKGLESDVLCSIVFVLRREFIKQLRVHLHEGLQDVVNQSNDGGIPVFLAHFIQRWKHDRKNRTAVVLDQVEDVFVVPVIQRPFRNLKTNTPSRRWKGMENSSAVGKGRNILRDFTTAVEKGRNILQAFMISCGSMIGLRELMLMIRTWKWGLATQRAIWRKRISCTFTNCTGSITSRISSISPRNMTSFCDDVLGQYLSIPLMTASVSVASFSMNCTMQYANCRGAGQKKDGQTHAHTEKEIGWWRNWQMPCRHKPYAEWIRIITASHSLERDTCPDSALYATESTLSPGTACVPPSTARQIR